MPLGYYVHKLLDIRSSHGAYDDRLYKPRQIHLGADPKRLFSALPFKAPIVHGSCTIFNKICQNQSLTSLSCSKLLRFKWPGLITVPNGRCLIS